MINEETLKKFITLMSECEIVWGVGGSFLLEKYELCSNPSDLDLWIQSSDMPKVRKKFCEFEEIETNIPYLTPQYHYKIMFYDMEVDFVACFIKKPNQNTYKYTIDPQNIKYLELNSGIKIPCLYLEDWYVIYKLLKRDDKAEMIKKAFSRAGISFDETAINKSINSQKDNKLPEWLLKDIANLGLDIYQTTLF